MPKREPNEAPERWTRSRAASMIDENDWHRCHFAKNTYHRCQMLGTIGHGGEAEKDHQWFCSLHYDEAHGHRRPELKSFELLQVWMARMARDYPQTQWNDDPQRVWERLHGVHDTQAVYAPDQPPDGDGEIPTREELDKILSRLKPGLWGDALKREATFVRTVEAPPTDTIDDEPAAIRIAQARRAAMLAEARSKGLIP